MKYRILTPSGHVLTGWTYTGAMWPAMQFPSFYGFK